MIVRTIRIVLPLVLLAGLGALGWSWLQAARAPDFADVAYGRTSPSQHLDIYVPHGAGPFPVVLFAHGGAFAFGDKRGMGSGLRNAVTAFNAAGIALVSIDYRLSGEAKFLAAVQDMKSALRFVRANAAEYRIDPARVALWGQSAGANIALVTGMSPGVALFNDPAAIAPGADDHVSAVVSMYGPTDFLAMDAQLGVAGCGASAQTHNAADSPESRYLGAHITTIPATVARANPLAYASAATPPLLLQHGTADCIVPPLQSRILADRVNAVAPGRAVLQFREGAVHADSAFDAPANLAIMTTFLRQAFAGAGHAK
ncbi:alpha/beta hydrolase [Novosphingobium sp.]|uniref:alpha/beta hydrolase n=1 Tax=Novosphingobium sp. TaxID=1874826 RepID=UPI0033426AE2